MHIPFHPQELPSHQQIHQRALARYLWEEMLCHNHTPAVLAGVLGLHPAPLRQLLEGKIALQPCWTVQLARLWGISPGLLWHWQQDILQHSPDLVPFQQSS